MFSVPLFSALRASLRDHYDLSDVRRDALAGITVGMVAVPLSMALAIATGVPPQHGLYTAIVAGAVAALAGGSRFNVTGPTAAFVVILFPIVAEHGLGGLLIATLMAGCILVALGLGGMGRLIQFVPYPVVLGFTSGIALVIAALQIPQFIGLDGAGAGHLLASLADTVAHLAELHPSTLAVGVLSLAALLLWPRLKTPVPAPLIGLAAGAAAAWVANHVMPGDGAPVATIASEFEWRIGEQSGSGVPPAPPTAVLPWRLPGADGETLRVDLALIRDLAGPAFAIAMLAAIESLLCSVVADGMTRTRHDANGELVGQGLANLVAPFFGGITATAALARTATNIRSGGRSPIAAVTHALVVLLAMVALAPLLGLVPMSALAALLFVVAWNMSEARHFVRTLRSAPPGDVAVLVACFGLTVFVDMVVAVAVGTGLAGALFIRRMALLTHADRVDAPRGDSGTPLPASTAVYDVNGPLFFAAAEKALATLHRIDPDVRTVIIDMHDVPSMDATAIVTLRGVIDDMQQRGVALILVGLPARIILKLRRAGIRRSPGVLTYCSGLDRAAGTARRWEGADTEPDAATAHGSAKPL
ncbi:C4-dicarboxylic acid transporter DauA [Algiphilus sp.]|uniref:C4-dicarboxylic acid transporter DauA n=1 Tax=Algiphilus sp. TaxID=1872431 RepID=UPI0025BE93BD|nr:C4-dicarboxylic acid transporter DauA [Algiphilus sp.]MCK5769408.1 C4-dicarboxylic acid transporter DauA [Algiphilus sp.]